MVNCTGENKYNNYESYRLSPNNYQDGSYPIDAVSMPVRNANRSIHSFFLKW